TRTPSSKCPRRASAGGRRIGGSCDVVGDLDLRPEAVALAGQDPIIGEIIVGIDVVLGQHDLALDPLGRARGAEAFLAGRERIEPAHSGRLEDGLALLVGHLVRLPFESSVLALGIPSPSSCSTGTASLPEASKRSTNTLSRGM